MELLVIVCRKSIQPLLGHVPHGGLEKQLSTFAEIRR